MSTPGRPSSTLEKTKPPGSRRLTPEQVFATLKGCGLLDGVPDEDICDIVAVARVLSFSAGTDIYREGDPCRGLHLLAKGRVRQYHIAADGRERVVGFLVPPAPFELAAAIDGGPYTSTATALDDSKVVFLPSRALVEIGRAHRFARLNTMMQLCREIRRRDISSTLATLKGAKELVACVLIQLAQQYGVAAPDGFRIDYRLNRQDVADRAGVRLETAIRILSDLTKQGVLHTADKIIVLKDMAALSSMSDCEACHFDCTIFASPSSHDR